MGSKILLALTLCTTLFFSHTASAQWARVGTGSDTLVSESYDINTICTDAAGNVYAAGQFLDQGGDRYVAKWDGSHWTELGTGTFALNANGDILSICSDLSGNIYAAGDFTNPLTGQPYVAKWNGTTWAEVGAGQGMRSSLVQKVSSICSDASGNIYASGQMIDSTFVNYIVVKWDGTNWTKVGSPQFNGSTDQVIVDGSTVYTTGQFTNGANVGAGHPYVAKYDGTGWSEVGAGSGALNMSDYAYALCTDPAHNVYVAGRFVDGLGNQYVAKWNGSAWSELGGTASLGNVLANNIRVLTADASGNIYAGGDFQDLTLVVHYVAKWNGSTWSNYGNLNANNSVLSLAMHGNIMYAAGVFTDDPNNNYSRYVAKYDPAAAGIDDIALVSSRLYPNPTTGACAISFAKPISATVTLTDLTGKSLEVWKANNAMDINIDISRYADGLYLMKIEAASGQVQTIKVVKD